MRHRHPFLLVSCILAALAASLVGPSHALGQLVAPSAPVAQPATKKPAQAASVEPGDEAQLVLDTQGFSTEVYGLTFSPDGKLLAAAGGKEVRIWNLETGELQTTLRGDRQRTFQGNCYAVAFSPDGEHLVVGIDDQRSAGSIRVYETKDLDEIQTLLAGHAAGVRKLAFSRDGKYLASAADNGQIFLWDWLLRRTVARISPREPNQPLYSVFDFASTTSALATMDVHGPRVLSIPSGDALPESGVDEPIRNWFNSLPKLKYPFGGLPNAVSLRFDQRCWIGGGSGKHDGRDRYWAGLWKTPEAATSVLYTAHHYQVSAVAVSRDEKWAASADVLGEVHVWDATTGKARYAFRTRGKPVYRVSFVGDGIDLAFGCKPLGPDRWRRNQYADANEMFDFEKRALGSLPGDSSLQTEKIENSNRRLTIEEGKGNSFLVSMRGGSPLSRYKIRTGAGPTSYTLLNPETLDVAEPSILGDDGGVLICVEGRTGEARREFVGHQAFVTSVSVSADGKLLASSSLDGTIRIWSLEHRKPTGEFDFKYLANTVTEVLPNTSAKRAGVRVADKILDVDGLSLTELDTLLLRGEYPYTPGDRVRMRLERGAKKVDVTLALREGADSIEPLLSIFLSDAGDWVAWTPRGYYDASPGADRFLGWHVNQGPNKSAKFYLAQQLDKQLHRPDVIDEVLRCRDENEAIAVANKARSIEDLPAFDLRKPQELARLEPPKVALLLPPQPLQASSGKLTVRAVVQSQNQLAVSGVTFLLNGRPVASQVRPADTAIGKSTTIEHQLDVPPGVNRISVMASNQFSRSEPISTTVNRPVGSDASIVLKPKLYVLAIGIASYQQQDLNLSFPARDATEFAAAMKRQAGGLYRDVETRVIVDSEASRENILAAMDWLVKSATSLDISMFFVSSHGFLDNRRNFYLATHEVNPAELRTTAIPYTDVTRFIEDLPGKVLVFADACHSGGITGAKGTADPLRDLVAPDKGAILFMSSTSREQSLEHPSWNHGAFTKAILEMLDDRKSDISPPPDGYLSIGEVGLNLTSRVKDITNGEQHPVVERPPTIREFNFLQLLN